MSLFIFVFVPLCWALLGKVLGWTAAAATFYCPARNRLGQRLGRWCTLLFPCMFLLLVFTGVSGNAGFGFTLFGSTAFFDLACIVPLYGTLGLGHFAGAIYVIRDLTIGHTTTAPENHL